MRWFEQDAYHSAHTLVWFALLSGEPVAPPLQWVRHRAKPHTIIKIQAETQPT